jgi:hypothetical protein
MKAVYAMFLQQFWRCTTYRGKPYGLLGSSVALALPPDESGGYSQETPTGFFMRLLWIKPIQNSKFQKLSQFKI